MSVEDIPRNKCFFPGSNIKYFTFYIYLWPPFWLSLIIFRNCVYELPKASRHVSMTPIWLHYIEGREKNAVPYRLRPRQLHSTESLLRRKQLVSYLWNSQRLMEPEDSLPCSQEPATDPYPQPDETIPQSHPIPLRHFSVLFSHLR
jgi:hypothetical protein